MPREIKPGDIYERRDGSCKYIAGREVIANGFRKFWRMHPPGGYAFLKPEMLQFTGDTIHATVES